MAMTVPTAPAAVRIAWARLAPARGAGIPAANATFRALDRASSRVRTCTACMNSPSLSLCTRLRADGLMFAVQVGVLERSAPGWTLRPGWPRRDWLYPVGIQRLEGRQSGKVMSESGLPGQAGDYFVLAEGL